MVPNIFLDTFQLTPSQEVIAKDIHGHEWNFKHTLRGNKFVLILKLRILITNLYFLTNNQLGTPQRHLFTSSWNEFSKGKNLVVGDCFVFLRYIFFHFTSYLFFGLWILTILSQRREWRIASWNQKISSSSTTQHTITANFKTEYVPWCSCYCIECYQKKMYVCCVL